MLSFRYMPILVPALVGSLIFAALAFGTNQFRTSSPQFGAEPTLSVEGTGTVTVKPDIASFTFSVHGKETTQEDAQTKAAEREAAILGYLREQGVADDDVKTENYNLSPRYEYKIDTKCKNYCPGEQVQVGYQVDESVTVTVRDLSKAGELVAGAGARGAENISSLSYRIDDPSTHREAAVAMAIENAHEKAKVRARSLGQRLGKLQYFSEIADDASPIYFSAKAEAVRDTASAPSLPSGETDIEVTVSVTYYLK